MSEFWLPTDKLFSSLITDIPPGRLVLLRNAGREPRSPSLGITFRAAPDRQMVLALTPFRDGRYPAGDAIDLSSEQNALLTLDATLSIEANAVAPAISGSVRDPASGELVDTQEGMAVAAYFGRHNPGAFGGVFTVDVATWQANERESPRLIFGGWRLRIDIADHKPIFWMPDFPTGS
jgi:hypothetical protein